MKSEIIRVRTGTRDAVADITDECADFARTASSGGDGLLHVFVPHATAGIAVLEVGSGSDADLLSTLASLLPADDRWQHAHGTRGHGRSHVMPALLPPYATFPVLGVVGDSVSVAWSEVSAATSKAATAAADSIKAKNPKAPMGLESVGEAQVLVRRGVLP